MPKKNSTNLTSFWIKWLLATLIGAAVGVFVTYIIGELLSAAIDDDFVILASIIVIFPGVFIGLGQWLVLQSRQKTTSWWTAVTAAGIGSSLVLFVVSFSLQIASGSSTQSSLWLGLVPILVMSILQLMILNFELDLHFQQTWIWLPATLLTWPFGPLLGNFGFSDIFEVFPISLLTVIFSLYPAASGWALTHFIRQVES